MKFRGFGGVLRGIVPDGFPIVTVVLLGLCALFYLMSIQLTSSLVGDNVTTPSQVALVHYGATYTPAIAMGEWWRTVTSVFLHGSIPHLLMNALGLFIVGKTSEERFGHARTMFVFVVAGAAGMATSVLWHDVVVGVGSSGAIFGLMGCIVTHAYKSGSQSGTREVKERFIPWLIYGLIIGFAIKEVDNAAHIGGLAAGAVLGVFLGEKKIARPTHWAWEIVAAATIVAVALCFYAARRSPLLVPG